MQDNSTKPRTYLPISRNAKSPSDAVTIIEEVLASSPWTYEKIKKAFSEQCDISKVPAQSFQYINNGDTLLSYFNGEWYYSYSITYYDADGYTLFEQEFTSVVNPSDCRTDLPTYYNWFASGCTFDDVTSTYGKEYYYYHDYGSNDYVDKQYVDETTVVEYIVGDKLWQE